MHRVELKGQQKNPKKQKKSQFLMHRVELKVGRFPKEEDFPKEVPNAPCGVERSQCFLTSLRRFGVPNAPCGVESKDLEFACSSDSMVPNAPCGVESFRVDGI